MSQPQPPQGLTIQAVGPKDFAMAVGWAADEGWNPGKHDGPIFHAADPQGFLMAQQDGAWVGSISAVRYGPSYGFIGFYIVVPKLRGQGIGLKLFAAGLEHLGDRVIGLDGVMAQQANYASQGFETAFASARYQAQAGGSEPNGVVVLGREHLDMVLAYDAQCFGAPRQAFVQGWISQAGHLTLGVENSGGLKGYGVLRPCGQGSKIGPLFADDSETAERLFMALRARAPRGPVFLDAPGCNPLAQDLVQRHHLESVFETARMYKNGSPSWPVEKVYGITTFELG